MPVGEKDTRPYSAEEKDELDQFLNALRPDAILVLNDWNWALRFAAMLPATKVIFRLENKDVEGELWKHLTPQAYFDGMKAYMHPRIILNVGNEPDGKLPLGDLKAMVAWYVEVMRLFAEAGIAIAVPAWGSGNPLLSWFADDAAWSILKPLFDAFERFPQHYLNLHSYFNRDGLQIGNGHIGRHQQIADALVKREKTIPSMLISEYGGDAINGLPGPWNVAFGETDVGEDRYGDLLVQGQQTAFNQHYVKGLLAYCWGAYAEWRNYNLSKAKRVQAKMIAANQQSQTPDAMPVTTPIEPPVVSQPPAALAEPAWMANLSKGKRARIAMGRLMLEFGDELRSFIVDDEAYELIGELAGMLDAKG